MANYTTIRRNAHRKIQALADQAIAARLWDHGDMGAIEEIGLERAQELLEDWRAWSAERGKRTSCYAALNEGTTRYGKGGSLRRQTVLTLAYHSNRGIDFILSDEPAEQRPAPSPCGISPQAVEPKSLQAELVEWLAA